MQKKSNKKLKAADIQKKADQKLKSVEALKSKAKDNLSLSASWTERIKYYFSKYFFKEFIWLVFYFFLLLPFTLVCPIGFDLDHSWQMALNMAIQKHMVWGRDIIFTYGPLGFMQSKYIIGISKWYIFCLEIFLVCCGVYALRYILQKSKYPMLCAVVIVFALVNLKYVDIYPLFEPLFLFYIIHFFNHKKLFALLLATLLVVIVFFVKVNSGIVLLIFLCIALLAALIKKVLSLRDFSIVILIYVGLSALLVMLLHVDLIAYLQNSLPIISGYNEAMFLPIFFSDIHVELALVIIGLYFAGFMIGFKQYINNFLFLCSYGFCAMYLFVLFKYAFVRADGHLYYFFMRVSPIFGVIYAFQTGRMKQVWGAFSIAVIGIGCYILANTELAEFNILNRSVASYLSPEYITDIFTDISYKLNPPAVRQPFRLPIDYLKQIGKNSVDIIPTEIAEIYYNNLNYDPRPIIQSYSCYNEFLDKKNYEKYMSATAPEYILFSPGSTDSRCPFWDESITKRAMLTNYQLITKDRRDIFFNEQFYQDEYPDIKAAIANGNLKSGGDHYNRYGAAEGRQPFFDEKFYLSYYPDADSAVKAGLFKTAYDQYIQIGRKEGRQTSYVFQDNIILLMKKRPHPLPMDVLKEKKVTFQLGQEYKIDPSSNLDFLYADAEYNTYGKLRNILFQPPQLIVALRHANGQLSYFKAIVPILKTGVLINRNIENDDQARAYFAGRQDSTSAITGITFLADFGFKPEITATIKEVQYPLVGQ